MTDEPFTVRTGKAPETDGDEPEDLFGAEPTPPAAEPDGTRRWRPARLVWALAGVVAVAILTDLAMTVAAALVSPDAAAIAWTVVYLLIVGWLAVVIVGQVAAWRRLEAITAVRAQADALRAGGRAPNLFPALDRLYGRRTDSAAAYRAYRQARADAADDLDRLALFEAEVLAPLDRRAQDSILRAARRTALFTAVSPFVALDMAVTLWRALVMLHDIAAVYGARAGGTAAVRLLGQALGQVAVAGGLELGNDLVTQTMGAGVTARLSSRVGQGAVNGLFMIRLGLSAMDACRPCGFERVRRPGVLALGRRALAPLRQDAA